MYSVLTLLHSADFQLRISNVVAGYHYIISLILIDMSLCLKLIFTRHTSMAFYPYFMSPSRSVLAICHFVMPTSLSWVYHCHSGVSSRHFFPELMRIKSWILKPEGLF